MTGSCQSPGNYERAVQLAEQGQHQEALQCIQEHLLTDPRDGEALNDAGAILFALGRFDEAAEHLKLALEHLDGIQAETLWNLAEVYLAAGRPGEALALFEELERSGILTADLANRVAAACLEQGETPGAVEAMIRSFDLCPDQTVLVPMFDRVRALRPKIAFFYDFRDFRFLRDIYKFMQHRFETRIFESDSAEQMLAMMEWCDIAWFEWCANQLITASRMPKVCKIICRLHRFEAYAPWPSQVNWANVDVLVPVGNEVVVEHLRRRVPQLERTTRLVTIPNGVDLRRFEFADRPRGKNVACVSRIHDVKNYPLLLQCFHKLHSIDPEYKLHIAGPYQDDGVLRQYLHQMVRELTLQDSVFFEGNKHDIAAWLADKHYIVSTSQIESQGMYILEGMACGLKPVIHTWPGCRSVYPQEFLFRTVDEFCQQVLEGPYTPQAYRDFVAERYPLAATQRMVNQLLIEMERSLPAKPKQAAGVRVESAVVVAEPDETPEAPADAMETTEGDGMQ